MSTAWNPAEAIEQVEAACRQAPPSLSEPDTAALARRGEYFAAALRFMSANPQTGRQLHRMTGRLAETSTVGAQLTQILDTALEVTCADFGDVQLIDPSTGALLLTTESGFDTEFLEYFAVVDDVSSACGRAAKLGQAAVFDVREDTGFAPYRDIAASAGFRGVQSTPLLDYSGRVVGMVSTHFDRPFRPADDQLRLLRLYADAAGEAIARTLGGGARSDPIGQALVSALLSPTVPDSGEAHTAEFPADNDAVESPNGVRALPSFDPVRDFASETAGFAATADRLGRRVFDVGLRLHLFDAVLARGDVDPSDLRAVRDAVADIVEDLDALTHDAALAVLALARERAPRPPPVRRTAIRRISHR